jgi:hypothetical protein
MIVKTDDGDKLERVGDMGIFLDVIIEQSTIYRKFLDNKKDMLDNIVNPEDIFSLNNQQIHPLYISTALLHKWQWIEQFCKMSR